MPGQQSHQPREFSQDSGKLLHMHETVRNVLVVGAAHIDEIAYPEAVLQAQASNPVQWQRRLGGVGINTALAISNTKPAATIHFIAAIGDDAAGTQLTDTLNSESLEAQLIAIPGKSTGRYTAILDEQGELYIGLADVSAAEALTSEAVLPLLSSATPESLVLDANLSTDCLAPLVRWQNKQSENTLFGTIALAVSPAKAIRLKPLAKQINMLFCNRREAAALTTQDVDTRPGLLADGLLHIGFCNFVLSDGSEPVLVQTTNRREKIPITTVDHVRHVNGAGDALAGATIAALVDGFDISTALRNTGLPAAAAVLTGTSGFRLVK